MPQLGDLPVVIPRPVPAALIPGARLLLAEDDEEMRLLLAWGLRRAGYDVLEAGNGSELLEKFAACEREGTPVELVIADVHMPGVTGLQALEFLRHIGCEVPTILITAFGDRRVELLARELGATAVLDKPFEAEQLEALIVRLSRPAYGS